MATETLSTSPLLIVKYVLTISSYTLYKLYYGHDFSSVIKYNSVNVVSECVEMHRQACCPEIFNNENGIISALLLLCMKTKKKVCSSEACLVANH